MKVTVLNENTVYKRGILGEHGLSLFIEAEKKRYLFDTGQSGVFAGCFQQPVFRKNMVFFS